MRRITIVLTGLLLLVIVVAACGGGAAAPTAAPAPTEPAAAPTEPAAEPTEPAAEPTEPAAEPTEASGGEGGLGTADNPIVMSFVPSGDTQEIITSGEEIATMITERTGLEIEANVATSYAAVVEAMCAGNAPVGWLNTFSYILANEQCGVDVSLATVRRGQPYYTGQIIANVDSGIDSLEDLEGKTMCWVDPLSTSGYIIPRVMVAAAGVDPDTGFAEQVEAGSHDNVVIAVYNGDCDAGATFVDARTAIQDEFPDVMEKVKIVAESPQIPNDTVSFAPDVPDDIRRQIVDALLDIAGTEEGQEALFTVYEIEGFEEVDDSFYDEFRTQLDASGIDIEELAR